MARKKDPHEPEHVEVAPEPPDTPAIVENADVAPLPVESPKPRRRARRSKEEIDAARAAEAEALAAEYRGQAAMIVDMVDAALGQTLPPPLDTHERAILEPTLARYMQAEQAAISPGWALFGAVLVIVAPRAIAAYHRYRTRERLTVMPGGVRDGTNHPDPGAEGNREDHPSPPAG